MRLNVIEQCDQLGPNIVCFLARTDRRSLSKAEIARRSRLSLKSVRRISSLKSWRSLKLDVAQRYAAACGHDLLRPRRNLQYLMRFIRSGRGFSHLTSQQRKRFRQMLEAM